MGAAEELTYKLRVPRRYNWKRDLPDKRDWLYEVHHERAQNIPATSDNRAGCPAIVDQGQIGSCTANALTGNLEFLLDKNTPLSRMFVYWNERVAEGDPYQDGGAEIRDGIKSLLTLGACSELIWPYQQNILYQTPPQSAYQEALNKKLAAAYRLDNTVPESLKACLANGFPFVLGFTVYQSFESDLVAQTGMMPMPNFQSEQQLGGHAVMAVGHDDNQQRYLIRNSWGTGWGQAGYFWMPYDYMHDAQLVSDCWTQRAS